MIAEFRAGSRVQVSALPRRRGVGVFELGPFVSKLKEGLDLMSSDQSLPNSNISLSRPTGNAIFQGRG